MVAQRSPKSQSQVPLSENRIVSMDGLLAYILEKFQMERSRWAVYSWVRNKKFPTRKKVNNYEWQFDLHEVDLWFERNPP